MIEATPSSPLSFMQKLSASVHLFEPKAEPQNTTVSATGHTDPRLIVVGGWMDANEAHLAKYICKYHELFPTSSILLLRTTLAGVNVQSLGRRHATAAVEPIRKILMSSASHDEQHPRLLVHMFSGGGTCSLHHLYDLYPEIFFDEQSSSSSSSSAAVTAAGNSGNEKSGRRKRTTPNDSNDNRAVSFSRSLITIPPYISIFDSAPAVYDYKATLNAVLGSLKPGISRTLAAPAVHLLAMVWWLAVHVLGQTDVMSLYGISVNDKQYKATGEVRRCYIYGENDIAVSPRHIEKHAREAGEKGFNVRLEKFEGSGHVSHARNDPERYWNIVKDAWYGREESTITERAKL
jgi:hypothetical protein